jgi:dihydroorotase-like cyclic amidohydrolase
MRTKYDILLKGGIVVDPVNRSTGVADVAIANGKIMEIGADLDSDRANESIAVTGKHVLPGIVDLHVHVSSWLGGRYGHRMMAAAGVTTALDMAGPVDSVVELARDYGAGLNLAALQYVRPGHTVGDTNQGTGKRMITTPVGERYIRENGLETLVVDPAVSRLHCRGENT